MRSCRQTLGTVSGTWRGLLNSVLLEGLFWNILSKEVLSIYCDSRRDKGCLTAGCQDRQGGDEMRWGRIKCRGSEGELLDKWGLGRGLGNSVDVEKLRWGLQAQ